MWELDCKKAERRRIDVFELWCWRRLLRVPWTARRFNQSILKKFSPGCSLEGMMLKLKLQSFGHLMRRVDSLEKTLVLGGMGPGPEGDDRGCDGWMASLTQWTWVWVNSGSWWWTGRPGVLQFMGLQRVGHNWVTGLNWTISSMIPFIVHWSQQTPYSNSTREDSTHEHHQMINTEIRLIIFFAGKDGEALYSQQKQDWELTVV